MMKYLGPSTFIFAACCLVAAPALAQTAVWKERAAPLYQRPSTQSKVVAKVVPGDTVRLLKRQGGWMQLRVRNKQKGWMSWRDAREQNGAAAQGQGNDAAENLSTDRLAVAGENAGFSAKVRSRKSPPVDGGLSLNLGVFGGDFSYVGRFFYRSTRSVYLEGTFQYVAGSIASQYLMHANGRLVRPFGSRFDGYATAGVGVINSVPIQSAGGKSVSNMALNYGLGVARQLKSNNWLRADLRQFTALRKQGTVNFIEFTVGLDIGIRWSKL